MKNFTFDGLFSNMTKKISSIVTVSLFLFSTYSPLAFAAYQGFKGERNISENLIQNFDSITYEMVTIKKLTLALASELEKDIVDQTYISDRLDSLRLRQDRLKKQIKSAKRSNQDVLEHLELHGIGKEIINRQKHFNNSFAMKSDKILRSLDAVLKSEQSSLKTFSVSLLNELEGVESPRKPSYSNDLDFIEPAPRSLYTSQAQIDSLLKINPTVEVPFEEYLNTDSSNVSSEAIVDLANLLGNDPLSIYQWVHDNIRFIPSYGVMQGADYTIQNHQGNAFDISSTLISLLRVSNIPSRYHYGTIALTPEQVQNWVGGVSQVNAATNLLSQGGIPQRQITYGGAIEQVELEHVWVEAFIDGQWIAMDPSFKQYEFTVGLDLFDEIPLDPLAIVNSAQSDMVVNEDEGWIQGGNSTAINEAFQDYRVQVEDLVNARPDLTIEEVLGTQVVQPDTTTNINEIELPFLSIIASNSVANLPDSLFYRFKYQLANTSGGSFGLPVTWGTTIAEIDIKTTELVGSNLSLSFEPATPADEDAMESYLPDSIEDAEALTDTLPANAIRMIADISLNGEALVTATQQVTLGQSLMARLGFVKPQGSWAFSENQVNAGIYQAIGIDMQGIAADELQGDETRLQETEDVLDKDDYSSLTKHDVVGGLLSSGIKGYMAQTYALDQIAAQSLRVVNYRAPSYGTFSTVMDVSYFFGSPRNVHFGGVVMDVDRLSNNSESKDNCYEDWLAFNRDSGMRSSAYEHLIPEQMFSDETYQAQGVSTAKALTYAMAEGQRIYTLTNANAGQLNNITIDDGARSEISTALSRGMTVRVHQSPITINGWTGSGYAITDPDYGIGAYKISGGANGGILQDIVDGLDKAISWIAAFEKSLGKLGAAGKAIKKVVSKVKKLLNAFKKLIQIWQHCNAGLALLGSLMVIFMIWATIKISLAVSTLVVGAATAICGPICGGLATIFIVASVISALAEMVDSTADYIIDGCKGWPA